MISSRVLRSAVTSIRKCHHSGGIVKSEGQTPKSYVHDGWAGARVPFSVANKWRFGVIATVFFATGFWAPFAVLEYHLRKANK
uniref:Cytochrome c oxidase polypeptide VIIc n=1 Tax=Strongyloides stercoralis TaxID=6248 RepID=A0A0K0EKL4_STRER